MDPHVGPSDLHIVAAQLPLQGLRILAVDDDEPAREALKALLESEGAIVTTTGSPVDALRLAAEWHPDVMLVDLGMPIVDGFSLVESLRLLPADRGGSVPVAAVTGYTSAEDVAHARRAGFQAYLNKPVDPGELIEVIKILAHPTAA